MQTATLLTYSLVAAVSVVSPGPATMLAIRNGAAGGVRAVLPSTLGNVTGLFLLSAAAMLGLGVVLQSSALLFTLVCGRGLSALHRPAPSAWPLEYRAAARTGHATGAAPRQPSVP